MNLEEILKENGVEEDTIKKITSSMKENKIYTSAQENIDIRYGKLNDKYNALIKEKDTLSTEYEQFKSSANISEELQGKYNEQTAVIEKLTKELNSTKVNNALQIKLLQSGALDIDYLMYRATKDNEITLNDKGEIENIETILESLKTAAPAQFKQEQSKKYEPKPLPVGEEGELQKSFEEELASYFQQQ